MGTRMAVAFANIVMARIENQILRQKCIETYNGYQGIFLECSRMLRCRRLTDLRPKAESRAAKPRKNYKNFTETENRP